MEHLPSPIFLEDKYFTFAIITLLTQEINEDSALN